MTRKHGLIILTLRFWPISFLSKRRCHIWNLWTVNLTCSRIHPSHLNMKYFPRTLSLDEGTPKIFHLELRITTMTIFFARQQLLFVWSGSKLATRPQHILLPRVQSKQRPCKCVAGRRRTPKFAWSLPCSLYGARSRVGELLQQKFFRNYI